MISIYTHNIHGRPDWYGAHAEVNGRQFLAWAATRHAAIADVYTQIVGANV